MVLLPPGTFSSGSDKSTLIGALFRLYYWTTQFKVISVMEDGLNWSMGQLQPSSHRKLLQPTKTMHQNRSIGIQPERNHYRFLSSRCLLRERILIYLVCTLPHELGVKEKRPRRCLYVFLLNKLYFAYNFCFNF